MNQKYLDFFKEIQAEKEASVDVDINHKVLIIDGLNLYIRVFSAVPSMNDNGAHIGGVTGFLRSLALMLRTFKPTRCVIVFDGKGGSANRKALYADYKGNRAVKTKFNRYEEFADIETEQESMRLQFQRLVQYLKCLPVTLLSIDNIEADDAIAYLATDVYTKSNNVIIASSDRDYLQLVNERVNVWSPIRKKLYTTDVVLEEYNVHPINYLLYRTVIGDKGDNLPKVPGVGPKTLLGEFSELGTDTKYDIDHIINKCNAVTKKKTVHTNILSCIDLMKLNEQLMQLHNVDIPHKDKMFIISSGTEIPAKLDAVEFKKLFFYDKLYTTIKDPETWTRTSFSLLSAYGQ